MKRSILRMMAFVLSLPSCPAMAAGTISFSLSQQLDSNGHPLADCKLYFYAAGTTTPQIAYQDQALTIPHPWPMVCDASGRLGQFYLADGLIKVRLADSAGVTVVAADNLLVIGPSSGGGGAGSVDPTTVYQTGDIKVRYGVGTHSGWVRANGRTIGDGSSGASERANADTQSLWEYICTNDTTLRATISGGGYSGNCTTDYNAHKTIQLPDWRGRAIAGLDDMGNSAAGVLTSTYFGSTPTTLGNAGGAQSLTILQTNIPSYTLTVSDTRQWAARSKLSGASGNSTVAVVATNTDSNDAAPVVDVSGGSISVTSGGGNTPMSRVTPTRLATIYLKL